MTTARSKQIDLQATSFYHCISHCVRRSFLCGFDFETKKDFSHRKQWLIDKFKYLTSIFSIQICAYAVMSNHYHLVLHVDDTTPKDWTDAEVIRRWALLYPKNAKENQHNPIKILSWRKQLFDISLFMKCINGPLARYANKEDGVNGRFWEGRFKSQALLDEGALLSAMVYVDLNPIRAGITQTPEDSEFTSIYDRIQYIHNQVTTQPKSKSKVKTQKYKNKFDAIDKLQQPKDLMSFSNFYSRGGDVKIDFKLSDYLELVDYTGRIIREDKRGAIPSNLKPILKRLNFDEKNWLSMIKNLSHYFSYAIGNVFSLKRFSRSRKRMIKGAAAAKLIYNIP